jgi:glycosyltransferase involved in cell wall biosynthesis
VHEGGRILFFRQGTFSHINDRVAGWLREQFPRQELLQVDILQDVIKTSRPVVWRAAAAALLTYPRRIACGNIDFRDLYYRTSYLCRSIRRMVAEKYTALARDALFTIQTQSLYDAGIEGVPHFLYTDHTHLANLKYPGAAATQLMSPAWIKIETALYHSVRSNLVMSRFVRDSLLADYGCDPASVAVVGAAPNLQPPDGLPANGNYSNRTILFIGIDWERKGGPVLMEAFRKVVEKVPDARLIIAGAAPEIRMPNVDVVGRVPLAEVSALLLRSSVLALPSWREPQGINVIESLMHGIPAVVTDVGALPEVVDDGITGRVIAPGDSHALAAALIEMLTDPALCRRYGEAAREIARARFSSSVVSRRMGDAIRAAL